VSSLGFASVHRLIDFVRGVKRKRITEEEVTELVSEHEGKGRVVIEPLDKDGKFVAVRNATDDEEINLGGWKLSNICDGEVVEYKFHRSTNLKPGEVTNGIESISRLTGTQSPGVHGLVVRQPAGPQASPKSGDEKWRLEDRPEELDVLEEQERRGRGRQAVLEAEERHRQPEVRPTVRPARRRRRRQQVRAHVRKEDKTMSVNMEEFQCFNHFSLAKTNIWKNSFLPFFWQLPKCSF